MRISVGFRKLVVHTVISGPVKNGSLIGNGIAEHEKESNGVGGFVGAVRPEAVDSDRDSKATAIHKCMNNEHDMLEQGMIRP